ncbi:MAG: alpha/beta fold hydrolase [Xanthomarina sp.]
MDSPDQGARGIPVTKTTFENLLIKFEITNAQIDYYGELKDNEIIGIFKQGGYEFPLKLSRKAIEKELQKRPQEPKEPFNYNSENIVFKNEIDNISLAGTFTYPKQGSSYPAVILISGSGPQDRNSEILNHKPFLLISDYLTNNGIAVLRVDDRGTAESEGNHNETGLDGFVRDTESALNYLKTRKEVDVTHIGLIGHSLGGLIAQIIASKSNNISFIVLLAGPGIPGDKLMLLQKEIIERKMGISEIELAISQKNMKGAYDIILKSDSNKEELQTNLESYFNQVYGNMLSKNEITEISNQLTIPWLTDFIKFNPYTTLSKTKCSVLALNGTNDLQVPAEKNLSAIEKTLKENGNTDVKTLEIEGLNHLFQESESGLPNEYEKIEQTFSPKALKIITDWIHKKTE